MMLLSERPMSLAMVKSPPWSLVTAVAELKAVSPRVKCNSICVALVLSTDIIREVAELNRPAGLRVTGR